MAEFSPHLLIVSLLVTGASTLLEGGGAAQHGRLAARFVR